MEQEIKKQREELTRLSNAVNGTQLELESLEKEVGIKSSEVTSLESEIESKKKDLDALAVDKDFLDTDIESLKKKKNNLIEDVDSLVDSYTAKGEEFKLKIRALEKEFNETDHDMCSKRDSLLKEIVDVEKELSSLKEEVRATSHQLNTLKSGIDSTGLVRISVDKALAEAQLELDTIVGEVIEKKKQADSLANLVVITAEKKIVIEQEIETKRKIASDLDNELLALDRDVVKLKDDIEVLDKEKFAFLEAKKSLAQKEVFIKNLYKEAGVVYPE